jgi:hypothetical protein
VRLFATTTPRSRVPSMLTEAVTSDRDQYGCRRDGFIVDDNFSAQARCHPQGGERRVES